MKKIRPFMLALAVMVLPAACSVDASGPPVAATAAPSTSAAQQSVATNGGTLSNGSVGGTACSVEWDSDDLDSGWDGAASTFIELKGDSIEVDGSGTVVDGTTVTIVFSGTYSVSGFLDDGQLRVDAMDAGVVRLILNGVDIACATSAPIYVVNATKTVITLPSGTLNLVEDGAAYVLEDAESEEPGAAIYSRDDLTFNGTGSLVVKANYNHGIQSKDDLKIAGGNISVDAANDGIKGRDSIAVRDGTITVSAGGDGMQSNNDEDSAQGMIFIEGGTLDITAVLDGIQTERCLFISGGNVDVVSGGGSVNSSSTIGPPENTWGNGESANTATADTAESAKGLNAGGDIVVTGGTVTIDASDDSIHSNGSIMLSGAVITLASGDDGVHADSTVTIGGGDVDIATSYEGIEGGAIIIDDGNIRIDSIDDGINVCGGVDSSSVIGRPGQNSFSSSGDNYLEINGGYVVVDADGDGLDVNGSITMTGGTVIVFGPTANMNGALDCNGGFNISGGFLVAAGSIGMAEAPGEPSTQNSVTVGLTSPLPAGTMFHVETESGQDILTLAPTKAYQSVVFSTAELEDGSSYAVYTGGSSTGTVVDGVYSGGEYGGGTELEEFTVSGAVTTIGAAGGQPGGGMPPVGMRP